MNLNLSFILASTNGNAIFKREVSFSGIGTHSKENLKGKLFVALKGKRFDSHDFLKEASSQGATGFLIHAKEKIPQELKNKTIVYVPDTLLALQSLASSWREKLKLKVIAITGTNGKTTTAQFVKSLITGVESSPKSFNNAFGVPLSLLSEKKPESFFIQEIGMSGEGEIATLCKICEPYVSAVTMVGPAHLETLGSVEKVALEKKQIYLSSPRAIHVFNQDNVHTKKMFEELKSRSASYFTFSNKIQDANVFFEIKEETQTDILIKGVIQNEKGEARVKVSGVNLENLMCAASLALACGVQPKKIWERLAFCKTPFGRHNWFELKNPKVSILFDAYNANPLSMEAFFKKCEGISNRSLFIIGDMSELGEASSNYHKALGESQALKEAYFIWYIGRYGHIVEQALKAQSYNGKWLASERYNKNQLENLKLELKQGDFIGIKASRAIGLEQVLQDLIGDKTSFSF